MRILIAEDEVELARGLKFLLEKNKFTVDIVHDGAEALDCFHYVEYDVIVLDIMMPKVNGLEVLRQIRKSRSGGACPHADRQGRGGGMRPCDCRLEGKRSFMPRVCVVRVPSYG